MIRRASSTRECLGFSASLVGGGSSGWLMVQGFKANPLGALELNQESVTHL
jgi:hypothetical protein